MGETSARISVKVKPRASRDIVEGWKEGALVVRLTSPPVDGAANSSLIRLLAKKTGVARSRIRIVSGEKGRSKILEFDGIDLEDLRERLI
ncbi:DUF167 domain-containing protein [bacterium]|nr:DUF167 domain-containing protein [bacterium]